MQSLNKEPTTVNAEIQSRVEELSRANDECKTASTALNSPQYSLTTSGEKNLIYQTVLIFKDSSGIHEIPSPHRCALGRRPWVLRPIL